MGHPPMYVTGLLIVSEVVGTAGYLIPTLDPLIEVQCKYQVKKS